MGYEYQFGKPKPRGETVPDTYAKAFALESLMLLIDARDRMRNSAKAYEAMKAGDVALVLSDSSEIIDDIIEEIEKKLK